MAKKKSVKQLILAQFGGDETSFYTQYPTREAWEMACGGGVLPHANTGGTMFPQIQSEKQFFSPNYANIPAPYQGGSFEYGGGLPMAQEGDFGYRAPQKRCYCDGVFVGNVPSNLPCPCAEKTITPDNIPKDFEKYGRNKNVKAMQLYGSKAPVGEPLALAPPAIAEPLTPFVGQSRKMGGGLSKARDGNGKTGKMYPIPSADQPSGQGPNYMGYPSGTSFPYVDQESGDTLNPTLNYGQSLWGEYVAPHLPKALKDATGAGNYKWTMREDDKYDKPFLSKSLDSRIKQLERIKIQKNGGGFGEGHPFSTQPTMKQISSFGRPTWPTVYAKDGGQLIAPTDATNQFTSYIQNMSAGAAIDNPLEGSHTMGDGTEMPGPYHGAQYGGNPEYFPEAMPYSYGFPYSDNMQNGGSNAGKYPSLKAQYGTETQDPQQEASQQQGPTEEQVIQFVTEALQKKTNPEEIVATLVEKAQIEQKVAVKLVQQQIQALAQQGPEQGIEESQMVRFGGARKLSRAETGAQFNEEAINNLEMANQNLANIQSESDVLGSLGNLMGTIGGYQQDEMMQDYYNQQNQSNPGIPGVPSQQAPGINGQFEMKNKKAWKKYGGLLKAKDGIESKIKSLLDKQSANSPLYKPQPNLAIGSGKGTSASGPGKYEAESIARKDSPELIAKARAVDQASSAGTTPGTTATNFGPNGEYGPYNRRGPYNVRQKFKAQGKNAKVVINPDGTPKLDLQDSPGQYFGNPQDINKYLVKNKNFRGMGFRSSKQKYKIPYYNSDPNAQTSNTQTPDDGYRGQGVGAFPEGYPGIPEAPLEQFPTQGRSQYPDSYYAPPAGPALNIPRPSLQDFMQQNVSPYQPGMPSAPINYSSDPAQINSPQGASAWKDMMKSRTPQPIPFGQRGPSRSTPFPGNNPSGMDGNYSQTPQAIQESIARAANEQGITIEEAEAQYAANAPKKYGGSYMNYAQEGNQQEPAGYVTLKTKNATSPYIDPMLGAIAMGPALNFGTNVVNELTGTREDAENYRNQMTYGNNMFQNNMDINKGTYTQAGDHSSYIKNPMGGFKTFTSQSSNSKYGGPQVGDEIYMDPDELDQFLKNGGSVEFIID